MVLKGRQLDRKVFWMIIAIEALLFYNFYVREISWYPAGKFDQAVYLTQVYRLQESVLSRGIGEIWSAIRKDNHDGGLLFPIEGALAGLLFGGTRLPQLGVLFAAFCALQAIAFSTARAVWNHRAYGYMMMGLILSQTSLWYLAGGLFDFRMDFLAYSLYGIWTCAVVRSRLFLDRGWAISCALIAAFLVLNRFLTLIYLVGVSAGFAVTCLLYWFLRKEDPNLVRRIKQRLLNLAISTGALIVIVVPVLLLNWKAIYGKYVVAQFLYEKDVRAREFGVVGLSGHLLYYPTSILRDHWGSLFLWLAALGIALSLIARSLDRSPESRPEQVIRGDETFLLQILFLFGAILGPIVVLTMDVSKSPVIGGITGVPAALAVCALMAGFVARPGKFATSSSRNLIVGCSIVVLFAGLANQFNRASRHLPEYAHREDLEALEELSGWLVDYANENGWQKPLISMDLMSESLNAYTITTTGYERSRKFIEFQRTVLGGSIMGVERAEALATLAKSDFLILTDFPKAGIYPFYERIAGYWSDLKKWADDNMAVARIVRLNSFTATVYVRPTATASVPAGDWITSSGLFIQTLSNSLRRFPEIFLSGQGNFSRLAKIPGVSATIESDHNSQVLPAVLRRIDNRYEIVIDTASIDLPRSTQVRIHLRFDTFFVPKKMGINDDPRELVLPAPNLIQLKAAAQS